MPSDRKFAASHINLNTPLLPAINSWEMFLMDQGRSPYTIKAFKGDLQLLSSYLPPDATVGRITTTEINHFLKWLETGRGIPCSPKSLSRRITSIKSFFRWLSQNGVVVTDPAEKVVQHSVISPLPEVLSLEEEQKVVQAALDMRHAKKPDARPYTLLTLLLTTGIKKGECLGISLNHIDLEAPETPILFIRYSNPSSRYKERKIALNQDWVETYQEYLQQYQPNGQLFPWSPRRLEYLLEDIGNAAGIQKHLSFDMCRWTSALRDWSSSMEYDKIRQKLGISKVQWREVSMKLRRLAGDVDQSVEEEESE
jgi:integrase/recombinase XerD